MNTIVTKILAVVVVLTIVGAGVVPIINALNTYTTTETETVTFGSNTARSSTVSSVIGTMSGTTFTEDASGDWIQIPLAILCNTPANTYKVLEGATIYAPDTNGVLAAFTVTSGAVSGLNTALTVTFTQDTSITDATVYDMDVISTNMELAGIIIPQAISVNHIGAIPNATKVVTAKSSTFYVDTDGNLYAAGNNTQGQLGLGDTIDRTQWVLSATNVDDVCITVDGYNQVYAFYVDTDGNLYATGKNAYGQFGLGDTTDRTEWTLTSTNVDKVYCPLYTEGKRGANAYYLDNSGNVYAAGNNTQGQLGLGDTTDRTTWVLSTTDVKDLCCDGKYAAVLTTSNELKLTGYSTPFSGSNSWQSFASNVTDFDGADWGAFGWISNGVFYLEGSNSYGQVGDGTTTTVTTPYQVQDFVASSMYFHANTSFAIDVDGNLYATGYNSHGQIGNGTTSDLTSWSLIHSDIAYVNSNANVTMAIGTDGKLYAAGYGYTSTLTETATDVTYEAHAGNKINYVDRYYITNGGHLYGVGMNDCGQFGTGDTSSLSTWTELQNTIPTTVATNTTESTTISDVRGSITGTTFTADADGAFLMVPWINLPLYSYQVGNGEDYYTANGSTVTSFEAPSTTGVTDASLTFTQNSSDSNVYDVTGTTVGSSYSLVVPYTVTYEETTTITHERMPMLDLIPLILIVICVIYVAASLIIDRRGY